MSRMCFCTGPTALNPLVFRVGLSIDKCCLEEPVRSLAVRQDQVCLMCGPRHVFISFAPDTAQLSMDTVLCILGEAE